MKIKNILKTATIAGLASLVGLAGCSSNLREERTLVKEKLDGNYTIKYIQEDIAWDADNYKVIIEDSSGNEIVRIRDIADPKEFMVKKRDGSIIYREPGKQMYLKEGEKQK